MSTELILVERDASLELLWERWLRSLSDFDRRLVTNPAYERELVWYDLFCSGEWSWVDLTEALDATREEAMR